MRSTTRVIARPSARPKTSVRTKSERSSGRKSDTGSVAKRSGTARRTTQRSNAAETENQPVGKEVEQEAGGEEGGDKKRTEAAIKAALTRETNRGVSKTGIKRLAIEAGVLKLAADTYQRVRERALHYMTDLTRNAILLMLKADGNVINPKFVLSALELCDKTSPNRRTLQRTPVFSQGPITRVIAAASNRIDSRWRPEKILVRKKTRRLLRALLEQKIIDIFVAALSYTRRKTLRGEDIDKALRHTAL